MRKTVFLLVLLVGSSSHLPAQDADTLRGGSHHVVEYSLSGADSVVLLPDGFIVKGSEELRLDNVVLSPGLDYLLDPRTGRVDLRGGGGVSLRQDTSVRHRLRVQYTAFPFRFSPTYRRRVPVTRIDSATGTPMRISQPAASPLLGDFFGTSLQKSGSIVRGFSVGTNQDLSLNSGFRLQMSGKIANDIDVVAALTDENSPIQPEGTTQTLQEIDRVYIDVRGRRLGATLGDFVLNSGGGEFSRFTRKLQGAKGYGDFRGETARGDVTVTGGETRGKYTSNQMQGLDGVQGPYRLTGAGGERNILVIAGTERVYVDGEQVTRGEANDYTIDYSTGELTFAPRRLISRASRLIVEFEYSDRSFPRGLLAARAQSGFFHNTVQFNATIVREADDSNAPIDVALSSDDRSVLRAAGDDRFKAVRSGIDDVGPGKGQYVAVDTVVRRAGRPDTLVTIYRYAPQDTAHARYAVTFSFVGEGRGDYAKVSLGQFTFVGSGAGGYLPVRLLPLPESQVNGGMELVGKIGEDLSVSGEYAVSSLDKNRLSELDDGDNSGGAVNFAMRYTPQRLEISGGNLGSVDLSLRERYVDRRFRPIERANEIEFNRTWNLAKPLNDDEALTEGALTYKPAGELALTGGFGRIKRGEREHSNRYLGGLSLGGNNLPSLSYNWESVSSHNTETDASARWIRQRGKVEYTLGIVTPGVSYTGEDFGDRSIATDTLKRGSSRFNEIVPALSVTPSQHVVLSAAIGWRWDDSLLIADLQRASMTMTQQYGLQIPEWSTFAASVDVTKRNRNFSREFRVRGNTDVETILIRIQSRYAPFDRGVETEWFYEAAGERTARLERVYQRVPQGTGNYVYLGDVNGNNTVDDDDFRLTRFDGDFIAITVPGDALIPVVDLKASTRIRLRPGRWISGSQWPGSLIAPISTETYLRVEEKSSDPETRSIYFLDFGKFLADGRTLAGSNTITQDLYLFEQNPAFSARLRYTQRKGLMQYVLQNERTYAREQSMRVRWQLVKEIANQIDLVEKRDHLASTLPSGRQREVRSAGLILDWSYRPEQRVELGFRFSVGRSTNFDTTRADLNDQSVRLVYSLEEKGQTRAEFLREEATVSRGGILQPFELTGGKVPGKTWIWRFGFDYRVAAFIQASMTYDGRSEGGGPPVHTAKAEVKAFF